MSNTVTQLADCLRLHDNDFPHAQEKYSRQGPEIEGRSDLLHDPLSYDEIVGSGPSDCLEGVESSDQPQAQRFGHAAHSFAVAGSGQ